MSIEMTIRRENNQSNLYPFFIGIKKRVNNILDKYINNNLLENTFIDINEIAYNNGIKGIIPVLPLFVQFDHSHLTNDDIILLNNEDDELERRFSIAHEVAHYILGRGNDNKVIARAEISPITETFKKSFFSISEFSEITKFCSKEIADLVSEIIGKPVAIKNALKFFLKTANKFFDERINPFYEEIKNIPSTYTFTEDILKPLKDEIQKYIFEIVIKVCEEEIADYFAANLLVPTERFILLEDETDEFIADKFKVSIKCIQKRREEIERERYFMIPIDQSSDTKIDELEMASIDELDSVLEANTIHVNGGF